MMKTNTAGTWMIRAIIRIVAVALMLVIGTVQAIGTILTALSAVILKSISAVMIFVTVLLQMFGLFTWDKTVVVLLIAGSMFWVPEGLGIIVMGLSFIQFKLRELFNK